MKLQLTTNPSKLYWYAKKELYQLDIEYKEKTNCLEINNTSYNFYNIVAYSHFIERIYYNNEDMVGFSLFTKSFIYSSQEFPSYLISMMIEDMNINNSNTIIDPCAKYGEVLIILGEKLSNLPQHTRRKTLYSKYFDIKPPHLTIENKSHYLKAIVSNNEEFKKVKENAKFFRLKINCSKFDLDWFDIKYHKGDFDFGITCFPQFSNLSDKENFERYFFYQMEFIVKKKIGIISKEKIANYQDYLDIEIQREISGWYYYIFKKKDE